MRRLEQMTAQQAGHRSGEQERVANLTALFAATCFCPMPSPTVIKLDMSHMREATRTLASAFT